MKLQLATFFNSEIDLLRGLSPGFFLEYRRELIVHAFGSIEAAQRSFAKRACRLFPSRTDDLLLLIHDPQPPEGTAK